MAYNEEWFVEMWNAGVDLLAAVPEEATEPGTPWYALMETMHSIGDGEAWAYGPDGLLARIER